MASNGHLSLQVLLDAMDNFHQKWECTFETKFHQFAQKYGLGKNEDVSNAGSHNMTTTNALQNEVKG